MAALGLPRRMRAQRRNSAMLLAALAAAALAVRASFAFLNLPATSTGNVVAPRVASDVNARAEAALAAVGGSAAIVPRTSRVQLRAEGSEQPGAGKKLLVLGGNGYVGSQVCRIAVARGYTVTSLSRRGENPEPGNEQLDQVTWVKGDATDLDTVKQYVGQADAVVHAIGLLFDVNSGLTGLSTVVSGSNAVPGEDSTYDRITRQTMFNVVEAVESQIKLPFSPPTPVLFVSAAEAGWPEVALGDAVENVAPQWLKEYLVAKRAVEAKLSDSFALRPVIYRPSLIWSWDKFDVLPVIPIFNIANALGVPFVDKTVKVTTLAKAIVAGLEDESVSGVQRFMQMEELEERIPA